MTETQEHELTVANLWFDFEYSDEEIRLSCELIGISFENVKRLKDEME